MEHPQSHIATVDQWCMLGERPHLVTGYLRQHFAVHFSDSALREHKQLRSLIWQEGDITGILVEDILRWKPENTEQRPAILIARGDYRFIKRGINSEMQGGERNFFAKTLRGSHTIFGVSSKPYEAELLGAEISREVAQWGPRIRQELDLMQWEPMDLGKLFKIKEANDQWAVPVSIALELEMKWKYLIHEPFLKTIRLRDFL
jgi:hypothetical protein